MDASGVPSLTLARVTPAEGFEAASVPLGESVRVKHQLNINLPRDGRRDARNKRPKDGFARLRLAIRDLDIRSTAAERTGRRGCRRRFPARGTAFAGTSVDSDLRSRSQCAIPDFGESPDRAEVARSGIANLK